MTQHKQTTPSFEEALTQLRETAQALEQGNLSLEETTALFERGVRLARACNQLLDAAELKVTQLQREFAESEAAAQGPPRQFFESAPAGEELSFWPDEDDRTEDR